MIYTFKEQKKITTILFNSGSMVSLIQRSLASSLFLKGFPLMTTLYKACKQDTLPAQAIHYDIPMKDKSGRTYVVWMIKVDHICDPQQLPNVENIQKRFPWLPPGSLECPKTLIGILLGQNCNILFPGSNEDLRHGNMRVRRSLLGD